MDIKKFTGEIMKVKLNYIGVHQPKETVEVEERFAGNLVATGNYSWVNRPVEVKPEPVVEPVEEKPNKGWTEKKIKAWIEKKEIDIDYDIKRDTKKEILDKLKEMGHI